MYFTEVYRNFSERFCQQGIELTYQATTRLFIRASSQEWPTDCELSVTLHIENLKEKIDICTP